MVCVSVNVENNASADKHMVPVRQVTISNLSLCDHPPLLILLSTFLYPFSLSILPIVSHISMILWLFLYLYFYLSLLPSLLHLILSQSVH